MSRGIQRPGKCQCGCGEDAPIAQKTNTTKGHIQGQPTRFIVGHHRAKTPHKWIVTEAGYATPCWLWVRTTERTGYGTIRVKGRAYKAHRHYWILRNGPIPDGLELDHLCRNRACVNPDHLEAVTHSENVRRGLMGRLTSEQVATIRADSERALAERTRRLAGWIASQQAKYGVSRATIENAAR